MSFATTLAPLFVPPPSTPAPRAIGPEPLAYLFAVDDDPLFCRMLVKAAARRRIHVTCFHPDRDFGRLPRDGEFDAAVMDYDLGALRGTQLSALYHETPILLVSARRNGDEAEQEVWPNSIHQYLSKFRGIEAILDAAVRIGRCAGA